jgi:RNA polymerase sigma factor (sigma-70 family)
MYEQHRYEQHSDDDLYHLFLHGEPSAYDALMLRYGNGIVLYLNGYLHDLHDSEDLMIETFARIMAKRPSIGQGNFKAYLYRTARNLASRFYATHNRMRTFSLDELNADPASSELLEDMLISDERHRILHLCLNRMDSSVREVLWLIYFENLSYAQAAKVMGITRKKIDNLLVKGKKLMREELGKEGIGHAYG